MKAEEIFDQCLLWLSFALFIAHLYLVFIYVPVEAEMGIVQKVFYFHVPVAWVAFLAFFVVFVGSILYLYRRQDKWDIIASSSAELGVLFTTLALITGSIWARAVWGVWWVWEPRLTTTLVLWFIYLAYLLIRLLALDEARAIRFAAVVGIVGFIDVPIVFLSVKLWRTQHPGLMVFKGGLEPSMLLTLLVSLFAFTFLYAFLLRQRVYIKRGEYEVIRIRRSLRG